MTDMGFTGMLFDIGKTLGALAVMLYAGVQGIDGFIMGNVGATDYVFMGIFVISMLFVFYMIQSMQNTTY